MTEINNEIASQFLNYLATGNPFIWLLLFLSIFILGWLKAEKKIRSLGKAIFLMFSFQSLGNTKRLQKERMDDFLNQGDILIKKIQSLTMSPDRGRHLLYEKILTNFLGILLKDFCSLYEALEKENFSEQDFVNYHRIHKDFLHKVFQKHREQMTNFLQLQEWNQDVIAYTLDIFKNWNSCKLSRLAEQIIQAKTVNEVILVYRIFCNEIFRDSEKNGLDINGKIDGLSFQKLIIKKL